MPPTHAAPREEHRLHGAPVIAAGQLVELRQVTRSAACGRIRPPSRSTSNRAARCRADRRAGRKRPDRSVERACRADAETPSPCVSQVSLLPRFTWTRFTPASISRAPSTATSRTSCGRTARARRPASIDVERVANSPIGQQSRSAPCRNRSNVRSTSALLEIGPLAIDAPAARSDRRSKRVRVSACGSDRLGASNRVRRGALGPILVVELVRRERTVARRAEG